jgi:hypothetical protein
VSPDPVPSSPSPSRPQAGSVPPPKAEPDRVVVRPYPKVIFFWLTWLVSLISGIVTIASGGSPGHLGTIWMCFFAFNLLVISFDFTETISIIVFVSILLVIFAGLYLDFLHFIGDFFRDLNIAMNSSFYFTVFGLFSIIYLFIFVRSRFDYWEFRHNEVIHRKGIFADTKRYSTEDLRWFKETPDVLESLLANSGRMILTTPREPAPIVIEHVIGIGRIDERVADILGVKRVTTI